MKELKTYKNLKVYITDLQLERLELITDFVINEYQINKIELFSRTRKRNIAEARRKIAFLARMHHNIEGKIIAEYLNVNKEWICQLIYSAFDYCVVHQEYQHEIQKLMVKMQMHYNINLKPLI